jgi:hypothetical protein
MIILPLKQLLIGTSLTLAVAYAYAGTAQPLDVLKKDYPVLYKLYLTGMPYQEKLSAYANTQGFRQPFENLATVIHENIHIASATHSGYYIEGIYYEPNFTDAKVWPAVTNDLVSANLKPEERSIISSVYMRTTPKNHLGNILDEMNAYSHVIQFVCKNEPTSAPKQIANLMGFLHVEEAYLRVVRSGFPQEYQRLSASRENRGALRLITERAWTGLVACGVRPKDLPTAEAKYFISLSPSP